MTDIAIVAIACVSIFTAGITVAIGSIGPALGEGRAAAAAISAIAQLIAHLIREFGDD